MGKKDDFSSGNSICQTLKDKNGAMNKKKILSGIFTLFISIIIMSFPGACTHKKTKTKPVKAPERFGKILIISFRDMTRGKKNNVSIRCPLSGKVFTAGPVEPDAESFMTEQLKKIITGRRNFKYISSQRLWDIQSNLLAQGKKVSERRLIVETGRKLGADSVLTGHIYRFMDRVGGNYAVDTPASVAFDLHLVRVSDGRLLWTGYFDETQKSLLEDLFKISSFFQRDGQWITSREMAKAALQKIMEDFEKL